MDAAQIAEIAPSADRELQTANTPLADAPLAMPEKLMMILFLIGIALFGLITVVDLVTSPFR